MWTMTHNFWYVWTKIPLMKPVHSEFALSRRKTRRRQETWSDLNCSELHIERHCFVFLSLTMLFSIQQEIQLDPDRSQFFFLFILLNPLILFFFFFWIFSSSFFYLLYFGCSYEFVMNLIHASEFHEFWIHRLHDSDAGFMS